MTERRFSLLERDEREQPEREEREGAPRAPARALERDGEVALDESGADRTHFCRTCEAQTRAGVTACYNCGSAIGGPDQELFDELKRRELAAAEREKAEAASRAAAVEEARARLKREREREAELERLRAEPRAPERPTARQVADDPRLTLAVLVVCLFATIAATLHLFLSAAYSDEVNWSVLAEVAITTIATWIAFTWLRGERT